jgi:hypothetical protein
MKPVENPLKNFSKARVANEKHGIVSSYGANTHQGI